MACVKSATKFFNANWTTRFFGFIHVQFYLRLTRMILGCVLVLIIYQCRSVRSHSRKRSKSNDKLYKEVEFRCPKNNKHKKYIFRVCTLIFIDVILYIYLIKFNILFFLYCRVYNFAKIKLIFESKRYNDKSRALDSFIT